MSALAFISTDFPISMPPLRMDYDNYAGVGAAESLLPAGQDTRLRFSTEVLTAREQFIESLMNIEVDLFLFAAIPIRLGHVAISGKRLWPPMRGPAITDDDRERIREFLAKPFLQRRPDDLREETDDNE